MPFEKIASPNVATAAAEQLRKLISKDIVSPGDQLPGERDLSEKMGISRTSLRAALQTLVAEGLLISKHGSGLYVPEMLGRKIADPLLALINSSPDAIFDYIDFRMMLEGESAAKVAAEGTPAELDHIQAIHRSLLKASHAEDIETTMRLDTEFHMAIMESTGNVVSIQVARSLTDLLQNSIQRSHSAVYHKLDGRSEVAEQHDSINNAIQNRDPIKAREAMRHHLDHFSKLIRRQLEVRERQEIVEKRLKWQTYS